MLKVAALRQATCSACLPVSQWLLSQEFHVHQLGPRGSKSRPASSAQLPDMTDTTAIRKTFANHLRQSSLPSLAQSMLVFTLLLTWCGPMPPLRQLLHSQPTDSLLLTKPYIQSVQMSSKQQKTALPFRHSLSTATHMSASSVQTYTALSCGYLLPTSTLQEMMVGTST